MAVDLLLRVVSPALSPTPELQERKQDPGNFRGHNGDNGRRNHPRRAREPLSAWWGLPMQRFGEFLAREFLASILMKKGIWLCDW